MLLAAVALAGGLAPASAQAPAGGPLFPQAFVVEHVLVRVDPDGTRFESEPVTDYYGGSWIVSVRSDGSRLVVDLARREITEIRPERGTYWSLSFERLAELRRRLASLEARHLPRRQRRERTEPGDASAEEPEIRVTELVGAAPRRSGSVAARAGAARTGPAAAASALLARPGVRHLEVSVAPRGAGAGGSHPHAETLPSETLEVWLDPTVQLTPQARAALVRLEAAVGGETPAAGEPRRVAAWRLLAAARDHADGAFPFRTLRRLSSATGGAAGPATSEDVALRIAAAAAFPLELVAVPEGLSRTVHPLEQVVAFEEQEAAHEPPGGSP